MRIGTSLQSNATLRYMFGGVPGRNVSSSKSGTSLMNEYSFEVAVRAVVRVQASDPGVARKVVESVLGAPGSHEIELANRNNHGVGRDATVTAVDFIQKAPAKLVADGAGLVAAKRPERRTA